jgi:predicted transcriptional regulator
MDKKIHIGKEIERVVHERNMPITEFASKIYCHRKNVYDIFTRQTIDIDKLILISTVLDYDFIHEVYFPHIVKAVFQLTLSFENGEFKIVSFNPL